MEKLGSGDGVRCLLRLSCCDLPLVKQQKQDTIGVYYTL